MITVNESFTAIGSGQYLRLERFESFDYVVSGTFVGTVVIEYSHTGGSTWTFVKSITSADSGNIPAITSAASFAWYRFRCTEFTSGTIVTSLADVDDTVPGSIVRDNKGDEVSRIRDGKMVVKGLEVEGLINSQGGRQIGITREDSDYTILKSDVLVFTDTSAANVTLTMPSIRDSDDNPITADDGRVFRIQKAINGNNYLAVTAQGTSQINSEDTDIIMGLRNDSLSLLANTGDWYAINRDTAAFGAIGQAAPGNTQAITATSTKLVVFDQNRFSTPGILTANQADDVVTIDHVESVTQGGDGFRIDFKLEVSVYSNNQEMEARVFIDGVSTDIHDVRSKSSQFNMTLEAVGIIQSVVVPSDIEIRVAGSVAVTATFESAILIIERIAK